MVNNIPNGGIDAKVPHTVLDGAYFVDNETVDRFLSIW